MAFYQEPPRLGNQYREDRVLRNYLRRTMGTEVLSSIEPELEQMGELVAGELFDLQMSDRLAEPRLVQFDPWGRRIDRIELTALWQRAARIAAERGVVATAYERKHGALSRIHQFALSYLFDPSSDIYTCPLAMSDGAARTLIAHGNQALIDRAVPRLSSRDPDQVWTSGQWMTERTGGSDVGRSETVAHPANEEVAAYGHENVFRLYGNKWFTSAATSEMALTLARPLGSPTGGRGLTLFYLETRRDDGASNYILVDRLKDKLGTRKLPTAELTLDGAVAVPVAGLGQGIRNIAPMLNVTRTWNAISAVAAMRRAIALARDYAQRRVQFGTTLVKKPLHLDTLAGLQAEFEAAFLLAFRLAELLGREEANIATESERRLLRLLTPIVKLTTAKQCVAITSEVVECFGGAGYVEDTGIPRLLRDAQVLSIWEGTTNVLSLDALRAIGPECDFAVLISEFERLAAEVRDKDLDGTMKTAQSGFSKAQQWLAKSLSQGGHHTESGARRFALTLGRSLELALLTHHAQWSRNEQLEPHPSYAAHRFAAHGCDLLQPSFSMHDTIALATEQSNG